MFDYVVMSCHIMSRRITLSYQHHEMPHLMSHYPMSRCTAAVDMPYRTTAADAPLAEGGSKMHRASRLTIESVVPGVFLPLATGQLCLSYC